MNPIAELDASDSETKTKRLDDSDDDEEAAFGRSGEQIDLGKIDVTPKIQVSSKQKWSVDLGIDAGMNSTDEMKIDVRTKEGFKDLMRFQLRIYDYNYDFNEDCIGGGRGETPFVTNPTLEELYYYCKYVIISGRMEKEIPILCLVYIERFLTKTGVLMNHVNWKRLTLISLILASKIWDDDSLENVHFP